MKKVFFDKNDHIYFNIATIVQHVELCIAIIQNILYQYLVGYPLFFIIAAILLGIEKMKN